MADLMGATETGQDLVLGSIDGRIDGRISQGIFSSFSTAEYGDQLREMSQVVGFIHDHEFLILKAGRIEKKLGDFRILPSHLDVLVHHFLSSLPAHQIPFGGLHKGVKDKIGSAFGHQRIQFLRGLSRRVNGRTRESPQGGEWLEILSPGGGGGGELGEEAGRS